MSTAADISKQMLRDFFWQAIDGTMVVDNTLRRNIGHYGPYTQNQVTEL